MQLFLSIIIHLAVGFLSSFATRPNIAGWYATLNRPSFAPPNYLFGPVWTVLYILMAISCYLVYKAAVSKAQKNKALRVYAIQLLLNFAWSFIFFYFKQIGLAAIEIVIMLTAIGYTIYLFRAINKWAAYLLLPYFIWVSFATVLNMAYWQLN
jgi:translocator protein